MSTSDVPMHLSWDKTRDTLSAAAAFASATIGDDTAYISHGEIQAGLSSDAEHWQPDLATLYAEDFSALDDDRDLLTAYDSMGSIVGIAVIAWAESSRRRFAVLEDMAIDPARRSTGIGTGLIEAITNRVMERGVDWLFLESGVRNLRAHVFFERAGFKMLSHVFAKNLGGIRQS